MTFCLLDKTAFCDHPLLCFMKVVDWYFLEICLFNLFGLCCQSFHCCFWLLKESLNIFMFVEFSSIMWCQLAKVFVAYFFNHKVSVLLRAFLKRLFCCCFEENFLKNFVLLSWTWFSFGFLLVNESALCLSWNLFLVFKRNEW